MASLFPKVGVVPFQALHLSVHCGLFWKWEELTCHLCVCACVCAAAGPGRGPLLPAPAGLQRLAAAGGVSQGGAVGVRGAGGGLPAPHAAGHPVRLRHSQGRQAAGHHHHSGEEAVTRQMERWREGIRGGEGRRNRTVAGRTEEAEPMVASWTGQRHDA